MEATNVDDDQCYNGGILTLEEYQLGQLKLRGWGMVVTGKVYLLDILEGQDFSMR